MLEELRVENLLLIERAELRLGPGLNVLTGETGAGKTVLAHALDLLLGGKPRAGIVRPGASEAYVEGAFDLPDGLRASLGDRLADDADELVLARRVSAEGRTRAYVNGRSATAADLRDIGGALLSFYGQHEHRELTLASSQLEILDGFCGPEQADAPRGVRGGVRARAGAASSSCEELRERAGARDRELDLLEWELDEIDAAAPSEAEEAELVAERERLRNLEGLRLAAAGGIEALAPDSGEGGATAALAGAAHALEAIRGVDADARRAGGPAGDARRRGRRPRGRAAPLRRGGGRAARAGSTRSRSGSRCSTSSSASTAARSRPCSITPRRAARGATSWPARRRRLEAATAELEAVRAELAERAAELRAARATAAAGLAEAVVGVLGELAMDGASFEARLTDRDEPGPSGGDDVEFLIAPNPGVPAGPLRDTASGGELSRVMLALMSVAAEAGPATLVFDEVDAGIGGQTARAVGDQLRALAGGRQVICITHLPQIASLADRHFTIVKDTSADPARTTVTLLERGAVVGEIVRMLGADADDVAARRHAKELLKAA